MGRKFKERTDSALPGIQPLKKEAEVVEAPDVVMALPSAPSEAARGNR